MFGTPWPDALLWSDGPRAHDLSEVAHAFHWPLEFPDIVMSGGFDLIMATHLGTTRPDEREFFSPYDPSVRFMAPKDQDARIEELRQSCRSSNRVAGLLPSTYASASFIRIVDGTSFLRKVI